MVAVTNIWSSKTTAIDMPAFSNLVPRKRVPHSRGVPASIAALMVFVIFFGLLLYVAFWCASSADNAPRPTPPASTWLETH